VDPFYCEYSKLQISDKKDAIFSNIKLHKEVMSVNTKLNNNIKEIMRYCTDEVRSSSCKISREMNWPYIEVMVRYKCHNEIKT
jgi:hypothetical protein